MPELLDAIKIAESHDRDTLDLIAERRVSAKVAVREHDVEVDRTLAAIEHLVSHYASKNATAATVLALLFPSGLQAHVQLPWIEQHAANDRVLKLLEGPTFKEWLDKHGVRPLIEELRTNHDAFAAAMKARDAETVPSGDDVKDARELGQELYLEIVAQMIALSKGKPELRRELLEPIWHQNQRVQMYRRQRRNIVDVNPDTGEELPEPADGNGGNAGGAGSGSPGPVGE